MGFNPFGGGGVSIGQVYAALADGNVGDVLTQTGVGTVGMQAPSGGVKEFWTALITQSSTDAPEIIDVYTNVPGLTMAPSYVGVGQFKLLPNSAWLSNSVISLITVRQYISDISGFVGCKVTGGLPYVSLLIHTFNTSWVAANDILGAVIYIEQLDT